jgi:hypothetical protein
MPRRDWDIADAADVGARIDGIHQNVWRSIEF